LQKAGKSEFRAVSAPEGIRPTPTRNYTPMYCCTATKLSAKGSRRKVQRGTEWWSGKETKDKMKVVTQHLRTCTFEKAYIRLKAQVNEL